jgi:hypothetical protein
MRKMMLILPVALAIAGMAALVIPIVLRRQERRKTP